MFQSLFFWIWNSDSITRRSSGINIGFNPCFSGYGIQTFLSLNDGLKKISFNPCFSGYGIQTATGRVYEDYSLEFQSLFFWIWNSDYRSPLTVWTLNLVSILVFLDMEFRPLVLTISMACASGFNPCFSGYGIQTENFSFKSGGNFLFQSLFFWIWNSDITIKKDQEFEEKVSILVFLDMEFRHKEIRR